MNTSLFNKTFWTSVLILNKEIYFIFFAKKLGLDYLHLITTAELNVCCGAVNALSCVALIP